MTDDAAGPLGLDDAKSNAGQGAGDSRTGNSPDRRELIKKLTEAAALPMLVAAFVASDATDVAASR